MRQQDRDLLRLQLLEHEGLRLSAYADHLGYLTIGVGRLIDERRGGGITRDEAFYLLDHDINTCLDDLRTFPWFESLSTGRQRALVDMRFQLGARGFRSFTQTLRALERGDPVEAARLARISKWAREQTPRRAQRVTELLERGDNIMWA